MEKLPERRRWSAVARVRRGAVVGEARVGEDRRGEVCKRLVVVGLKVELRVLVCRLRVR